MKITDNEIKRICSPVIYKRGMEYYKEGRVHLRVRKPDSIAAAVDGDELYNVHITLKDDKISDTLCTCPYYNTMGCACKHIVAVLKTRQAELDKTEEFENENDCLASRLCTEFNESEKDRFGLSLTLRITPVADKMAYSAAIKLIGNNTTYSISMCESFFDMYLRDKEYKLAKNYSFSRDNCYFEEASAEIMELLCEAYENKSSGNEFYLPKKLEVDFGASTAKRLFPLLKKINCDYIIDSMPYNNIPIIKDNPDILVDISAMDKNINISVTESGIALIPDGSVFFFDNKIFLTDEEWRGWFMPIYRAMIKNKRTQLEFVGDNSIEFAAKVLPKIRSRRGVVCYGVEELVINEKPVFEIYFDRYKDGISAAVKVFYGSVSIMLPAAVYAAEKIVVRDRVSEEKILGFFKNFRYSDGVFLLFDEDEIFEFMTEKMPGIEENAKIFTSDSFEKIIQSDLPDISAFVSYNKKIDLLELELDSELSKEDIDGILEAYYSNMAYFRFADGSYFDLAKKSPMLDFLSSLPNDEEIMGKRKIPKFYALYLASRLEKGNVSADENFMEMIDSALNSECEIPDYLDGVLRDYQKTGVKWFEQLSALGLGGILADDMGLGKTLQVIAFVMSKKCDKPVLVVAPSSLTYNWFGEIMRFAPDAKAKIIDGPKEERELALSDVSGYDFIITSYALLRRDIQIYQGIEFSYCFIDEAQHIKNARTMNARAVKKVNASGYFALTGTPIENSLSELWSIFDFVLHGYLSTQKEFSSKYEKAAKGNPKSILSELRNKVKPFILRRMKKDVLTELPDKIENTIFADFEKEQKAIYSAFLSAARKEADVIAASGENTMRILSLLTRLRQICCHPRLIDSEYKKESGKLELLSELVTSAVSSGHRVLIFSQFTSMLTIIDERLRKEGITTFYLDGSTPSAERVALAERFNAGESKVFLISLKAGGTGLNLVGADMVIHYDPWWNPAVMDQASDRAHRIGQTKAVQVIKLAARNSIEEQILKLAEKKRGLADGIIRENKSLLSSLTREELLGLFE